MGETWFPFGNVEETPETQRNVRVEVEDEPGSVVGPADETVKVLVTLSLNFLRVLEPEGLKSWIRRNSNIIVQTQELTRACSKSKYEIIELEKRRN